MVAAFERFVDALDAVGIGPFVSEYVRKFLGCDAGVGGWLENRGRIEGTGHRVVGNVDFISVKTLQRFDPSWQEGTPHSTCRSYVVWNRCAKNSHSTPADRNLANRLIRDVALVVAVDHVLRGPAPGGERRRKTLPSWRQRELIERHRVQRCVVEGPFQARWGASHGVRSGFSSVHER